MLQGEKKNGNVRNEGAVEESVRMGGGVRGWRKRSLWEKSRITFRK